MTRTFADDVEWKVYARDTFDRESPATVDATGRGLVSGLLELWRRVLTEGVHDSGSKTFTDFTLHCADRIDVGQQPTNREYAKLRGWLYGTPGPYEAGGARDRAELVARENTALMTALVAAHARLLAREDRILPGWDAQSAAGQIRACIARCADATILVEQLAML